MLEHLCFLLTILVSLVQQLMYASAQETNTVILDFVGDISFDGPVLYQDKHGYCSYNKTFEKVARYLCQSDLAIGNLEAPFIREDMENEEQITFHPRLRAYSNSSQSLRYAGFDIMGLNNNHLNDFKDKPVNYTIRVLKEVGIKAFGYTFGKLEEKRPQEPLIVNVKGITIGFLGYCDVFFVDENQLGRFFYTCVSRRGNLTAGPAVYSDETVTKDVKNLKVQKSTIIS
ncbi:Capsule biosynthesis protein CapA [Exaiptasia diaphana]|nr:Capsule biosynthesis protein CapA [Exaiptasia diaphana]